MSHKEGIKLKDYLFFFPSFKFWSERGRKNVKVDHLTAPTERFDITFEKKE